jgi:hypothetical protein
MAVDLAITIATVHVVQAIAIKISAVLSEAVARTAKD